MESNSVIGQNEINRHTCLYCQSFIKKNEDLIFCPECNSPHHIECWYENAGCAQYGCKCRISREQLETNSQESISAILINAEYLKNTNKFVEAINECSRVLKADRRNNKAKQLYNEAVKLINAKTKLIEQGESALEEEKLNEADIFFTKALNYADDVETNLLNAKIEIIRNQIPKIKRKKFFNKVIVSFISLLIISSLGFLFYYFYFLKEERELSALSKNDNSGDIQLMEQQVTKYEKFLGKYKNSKYYDEVKNKISLISAEIVISIYKDDWRQAQEYLSKIEEKETNNDLYKKIYGTAKEEFKKLIYNAKQFNKLQKFDEAKSELEKSGYISDRFPDSDMAQEKSKINSNLILLERKRKAAPEVSSVTKKINDISAQLKNFQINDDSGITEIEGEIIDKDKNPSVIVVKKLGTKKFVAVSGDVSSYDIGEFIVITCKKVGLVSYGDEDITEYATYSKGTLNFDKTEKESLFIELNNLKSRKQKLDSLINLSIMTN